MNNLQNPTSVPDMEQIYRDLYPSMMAYANTVLQNTHLAEEAVQDTFQIAWMHFDQLSTNPNPRGWVILTLKNVLRNTMRRRAALQELMVESLVYDADTLTALPDSHLLDLEYSDLISKEDYTLLKLVALQNYTILEAAQALGISREACKKRIQRAREKLRCALNKIQKIK